MRVTHLITCCALALFPTLVFADTPITTNITTNQTWSPSGGVYIVQGMIRIASGVTLTIKPGTIVKFDGVNGSGPSVGLVVDGTLIADSAALSSKIYFTSYKDDTVGGDTNGDGSATSPAAGDWNGIKVHAGATATLKFAVVRYGGYQGSGGSSKIVWNNGGILTMNNSEVATSSNYGIYQSSGTSTILAANIHDNAYGLYRVTGTASIGSSAIHGNTSYGVYSENNFFANNIHAQYNYWGASDGPFNLTLNPFGSGDNISSEVDFTPFLQQINYLWVDSLGVIISGVHSNQITYVATSTQYMTALYAAVATWNAQNKVMIATSTTPSLDDVWVFDMATTSDSIIVGQYAPNRHDYPGSSLNDTLVFNPYYMSSLSYTNAMRQNVTTHELGHALGLWHSYLGNIMNAYVTTLTALGNQDMLDLDTLW